MAIVIDLAVIGIILLTTFIGYKRGLIGVAFKILSFIIALVITLILFKPVSSFIMNKTELGTTINTAITEKLESQNIESGEIKKEETDLPNVVVDYVNKQITNTVNEAKNSLVETLAKDLTETIINIIVIVVIFIISKILLLFAKTILEAVAELPILKQFNEIGGIIYGLLKGILIIYVILTIISLILPMMDKNSILQAINSTILTKILYNNNLILMIFFR